MKTEMMIAAAAAICAGGCIQLKKAFADENTKTPQGGFRIAKGLVDRGAAGISNRAMLEARPGATDEDKLAIAEENARRLKELGVRPDTVKKERQRKKQNRLSRIEGAMTKQERKDYQDLLKFGR